jgi:hypothetical protein
VIAILSVTFFGHGMVGLGWTVISDVAPKELMGMTGGLFNFATNPKCGDGKEWKFKQDVDFLRDA